jgi:hypothetical protein
MSIESDVLLSPEIEDDPSGYIASLITQAQQAILEYTKYDTEWPEGDDADATLDAACVRLTICLYRRGGVENAKSQQIGSVTVDNYEMRPEVNMMLSGRRRCGGWF